LIVRCNEIILYDGPNPYRKFPLVPIQMTPPLFGFWCPPPVRYALPFQQLAETAMSQVYENQIRLNNGMVIVNRGSGLNKDRIRGLPGELIEVDGMNAKDAVFLLSPAAFPDHYVTLPDKMLARVHSTFGSTDSREGKAGAGNISVNLYEASLSESQKLTRLRAKMLAQAITDIAEGVYSTLIDYQLDSSFPLMEGGELSMVPWDAALPGEVNGWDVLIDPSSIRPVSMAARRSMVPVLRNMGMMSVKTGLKWLEIPDAETIFKELATEATMAAAQAEARKGQKGGKK
jgi:hypothetical protein